MYGSELAGYYNKGEVKAARKLNMLKDIKR